MAGNSTKPKITYHAILFLTGILLCTSFFLIPDYDYGGGYYRSPQDYEFILSVDSPVFRHNITMFQVGISSLQTNNTPVSIVVRCLTQVIFNATNISSLSEFAIEIPTSGFESDWWLEVIRQDSDVNINITIHHWYFIAITVMPSPIPYWAPILGVALSGYALYKLLNTYIDDNHRKKTRTKTVAIILLLIIGPLCCYPLIRGGLNGDFTPENTPISLPDEDYFFTLNATYPNSSIDLSLLYPEEVSSVSFNIHSMISSEYPLQLMVILENTYNLTLEEESNTGDWWITIPTNSNSTSIVSFGRIDTDLDIEISVEAEYRILVSRQDISLPTIFGILGVSVIIVGIYFATRIDRYLADELANLGSLV